MSSIRSVCLVSWLMLLPGLARANKDYAQQGAETPKKKEYDQAISPADTIHAVVNGEMILREEVLISCRSQMQVARNKEEKDEIFKSAVESLIDREAVLQYAFASLKCCGKPGEARLKEIEEATHEEFEKTWLRPCMKDRHYRSLKELEDHIRQSGMTLQVVRRWWERNWMAYQYLCSRAEPLIKRIGDTEVAEYYKSHRDQYTQPDSVDWQDIYLDASRAAAHEFVEVLVERVQQGEDFAKLSAEFDNGDSGKFRKGAGQGHKRGEIFPPQAEPLLFAMHEGDMKTIEVPNGCHVIRLVKRQYAGAIPFDAKVQKEIHDKICNEVFQREKERMIKELKRKAIVVRCDE